MRCTPGDPCGIHAPAGNLLRAMVVALPRLVIWHRPRMPRLRLLTGTRPQQAALVLALRTGRPGNQLHPRGGRPRG
jgi:hypothetical protein